MRKSPTIRSKSPGPRSGAPGTRFQRTKNGAEIPEGYAWLLVGGLTAILFYYDGFNPNHKSSLTLLLASLVLLVSCLPLLLFLVLGRTYQVPALEAHGLFYAVCFGFAGFLPGSAESVATIVDEADLTRALSYTLMGMLALLFGYYTIGPRLFHVLKPMHPGDGVPQGRLEWLGWLACLLGTTIKEGAQLISIPTLGQLGGSIYTLGFFLLLILVLEGRAGFFSGLGFVLLVLPMELILNSGLKNGQLAGAVTLSFWVSLVIFRAFRRIPILLLAGAFAFFIVLQPVKFYVRSLTWDGGVQLGPLETLQVYVEGFRQTYGSSSAMMANRKDNFEASFDRINHLSTTAAIIRDTPSAQPFLLGKTYLPLLTKWIPRVVWHGKPEEHLGNSWASHYGYLGENDTVTSFNLPWLPEMYMNFGWAGVVGIMFLLGLFFRLLWVRLMGVTEKPVEYAVAIAMAQSLVFAESNLSLMAGGIIIFSASLWVLFKLLQLTGDYNAPMIQSRRARIKSLTVKNTETQGASDT